MNDKVKVVKVEDENNISHSVNFIDRVLHFLLSSSIQLLLFSLFISVETHNTSSFRDSFTTILFWIVISHGIAFATSASVIRWFYSRRGISARSPMERINFEVKGIFQYILYILLKTLFITLNLTNKLTEEFSNTIYGFIVSWFIVLIGARLISWYLGEFIFG